MNLHNSNKNSVNVLVILGFFLLAIFIFLMFLLMEYRKTRYEILTSVIPVGEGVRVIFESPLLNQDEESPDLLIEKKALHVVSTGKVSNYRMKDNIAGERIANASVLTAITKDSNNKNKTIKIILQIFPVESPDTNIFPAVVQTLSRINPVLSSDDNKLTNIQLEEAFPWGSEWLFVPITDPFSESLTEEQEVYREYSKRYYGNETTQIKEYIDSGLIGKYNKPLLINGMSSL